MVAAAAAASGLHYSYMSMHIHVETHTYINTNTLTPILDASKVPPSKFQKRKGSTFSTPPSRDGHVGKNADRDASFHKKHDTLIGKVKEVKDKTKDALGHGRKSSSGSAK